jgi:hypothetical protein
MLTFILSLAVLGIIALAAGALGPGTPPTNAAQTYDIGTANREDLLDVITNITPTVTPFFSSISKGRAYAKTHEWPEDTLTAAQENAWIEGADAEFPALVDRTRPSNFCQLFINPFAVTGTQEAVTKAGVTSEFSYQMTKKMKEHVRDIEWAIFNNAVAGVQGTGTTATKLKGISAFIDNGNDVDMSNAKVTEPKLNEALQNCWTEGGEPNAAFMNIKDKENIDAFTTSVTRNIDAAERKQIYNIAVYEGSTGGMIRLIPSRFITKAASSPLVSSIYVVELDRWSFDFLRNPREERLAKTGDSMKGQILCEGTLVGKAAKANAEITNVTAA